ncbi:hypothetical protein [Streptomyces shenzhenensis]|uniref:Uncharacterized protein n=1 Tax=Streptomyces shenzhenensis TaxID=943815 RepID=A0A3M0IFQ4_9ACTN|nr:hypothetical protein [Streptomyces shenzhenensis]RMB85623.1 hypothetical protein CTZ28_12600 [Streptomyces shenzhenensis]
MKITHTPMARAEVIAVLGPHWPPLPGATVARISALVAVDHGAVAVHDADGRPGTTWWVIDGLIVPQDAGPPPQLPGIAPETIPVPEPAAPPLT